MFFPHRAVVALLQSPLAIRRFDHEIATGIQKLLQRLQEARDVVRVLQNMSRDHNVRLTMGAHDAANGRSEHGLDCFPARAGIVDAQVRLHINAPGLLQPARLQAAQRRIILVAHTADR